MARYVCNYCDSEPSDGLDGLCQECRDHCADLAEQRSDEFDEPMDGDDDEFVPAAFTDAEIERSQALLAHLLGFTDDDLK